MKDLAGYYAYRILSGLFGLLPEPVMRRVGYASGWIVSFTARRRFQMAVRHQRRVLGDPEAARRSARKVFAYYGRYWAETFWMRPRRARAVLERSDVRHLERLHQAVDSRRGVVLALPHLGNWEVAGLRAAEERARALAVAEALGNERIVQWFVDMRAMVEIDVIIARKGAQVTRRLLERLRSGGVVALLCDRDLTGRGVPVEFFGEETTLPAGPVSLAVRSGAVLLPVGTYFRSGAGHDFVIEPPIDIPAEGELEERVAVGTQRLARVVEDIIRRAPEQWHLVQPNWPSDREVW